MQNALIFILRTLMDLYLLAFAVRLLMYIGLRDGRNPLAQFIHHITNPLVQPLQRLVPAMGRFHTATAIVLVVLQGVASFALIKLGCLGTPGPAQLLALALLGSLQILLRVWFWSILITVVLSWINPGAYNPATAVLSAISEPILAPIRRYLPGIGGFDLSPLVAIILIQALLMTLPIGQIQAGLLCFGRGGPLL